MFTANELREITNETEIVKDLQRYIYFNKYISYLVQSCLQQRFLCIFYDFLQYKWTTIYGTETTVCGRCVRKKNCESEK